MSSPIISAADWSSTDEARAIISRLCRSDLHRDERPAVPNNVFSYRGLTPQARKGLQRLENLRREAVDSECGFTFADAQHPYDELKTQFWLDTENATPSVYEVLTGEFDSRRDAA